jgi:hypothetical protein
MRQRARTDLCGGRSVMVVPTATLRVVGWLLPLSWKGVRSGVSRNRPLRTPSVARKLPALAFPNPRLADPPGDPN